MDEQNLATEMRNRAGENFRNGFNCAEAVFTAFREMVAPDLKPELVRMFT